MVIISKIKAMMGNFVLMLVAYAGILRPTLLISRAASPSSALFLGGCAVWRKWCLVLNWCRFCRDQWQGRRPGPRWWAPPPSCTLLTRDGFPLWMPEGAKQNTNVTTPSQWADMKRLNDCSFSLILRCQTYCMFVYLTLHSSFYVLKYSSRKCKSNVQIRHAFIEGDTNYLLLICCLFFIFLCCVFTDAPAFSDTMIQIQNIQKYCHKMCRKKRLWWICCNLFVIIYALVTPSKCH